MTCFGTLWKSRYLQFRENILLFTSYNSTTLPDIVLITSVLPQFTIIEFEHDTLRILLDYLHTGSCPLTCSTIPGLICAAEHYDLPELLQACFHHAKQFLRIEVVSLCYPHMLDLWLEKPPCTNLLKGRTARNFSSYLLINRKDHRPKRKFSLYIHQDNVHTMTMTL